MTADTSPTAHLVSRLAEPVEASKEALAEAEAAALSFEADELTQAQRGRRLFAWTSLGLGGLLGLSTVANWRMSNRLVEMSTRPRVDTVVVGADTGSAYRLSEQVGPPPEAEAKYVKQLTHLYLLWREEYYRPLDVRHFSRITWLSTAEEQYRFKLWWEKGPDGPRVELAAGGEAHIQVLNDVRSESSKPGEPNDMIEYRIRRTLYLPNRDSVVTDWKIILFYGWDKSAIRSDVEFVNPYGFVVTRYLRDKVFAR